MVCSRYQKIVVVSTHRRLSKLTVAFALGVLSTRQTIISSSDAQVTTKHLACMCIIVSA